MEVHSFNALYQQQPVTLTFEKLPQGANLTAATTGGLSSKDSFFSFAFESFDRSKMKLVLLISILLVYRIHALILKSKPFTKADRRSFASFALLPGRKILKSSSASPGRGNVKLRRGPNYLGTLQRALKVTELMPRGLFSFSWEDLDDSSSQESVCNH